MTIQYILSIIVAIVTHLIPDSVAEFNVQIIDVGSNDSTEIQLTRQAEGGWKVKGKELKESLIYQVDGTKVTTKSDDKTTTEDLAKYLTMGTMPFKMKHHAEGLDFFVEDPGNKQDSRVLKVRWKEAKQ